MRILFVSPEVFPLAKVGGLGDVAYALPKAIHELGHDIRTIMPRYPWVEPSEEVGEVKVPFHGVNKVKVWLREVGGVPVYLLENAKFFERPIIYEGGKSEVIKFAFFSRAVIEFMREIFKPEVVHCNDWHNALVPMHLKLLEDGLKDIATVFTIHNLKYQGICPGLRLQDLDLGAEYSPIFEKGEINIMKAGILYADVVNTVSKSYAREIKTKGFGRGLEKFLRQREVYGIVNGVDYGVWDPSRDELIYEKYDSESLSGKFKNKLALLEELGLRTDAEVPLIGMVTRLDPHKGLSLVLKALPSILDKGLAQFVMLGGVGEPKYQEMFENFEKKVKNAKIVLKFDETLAHKIYAGSDMFLMPSLFEPCGLGQLIAMKYGTIPIVRKTGGLADTVIDFSENRKKGNGFVFERPEGTDLKNTILKAIVAFKEKKTWEGLIVRNMKLDYSWRGAAMEYVRLYREALHS